MRIVQILMKYHALFVIFEKAIKIWNCRLLQIVGPTLRSKYVSVLKFKLSVNLMFITIFGLS